MENEILLQDLKMIYYALLTVFGAKQCRLIFTRLAKRLKKVR